MKLADVCIQRPVFATMLVSAGLVVGAFCFKDLGASRPVRWLSKLGD
jgi:multidrug efflux pump subunit AcrB